MPSSSKNLLILLITFVQAVAINLFSNYLSGPSSAGWQIPALVSVVTFLMLAGLVYVPSENDKELKEFRRVRDEQHTLTRTYQDDITRQKVDYNRAIAEARIKAVQAGNFQDVEKLDQLRRSANGE